MPEKMKLEHYVPRFYLQYFSFEDESALIHCFDKTTTFSFKVNCKNVASETYFYDTTQDTEQLIEKSLSGFESAFKVIVERLFKSQRLDTLSPQDKLLMSHFIIIQEFRTKEHRLLLQDMNKQVINELKKRGVPSASVQKLELTKENIKQWHISEFEDVHEYANLIFRKKWTLLINKTHLQFWCSDHPVNRHNEITNRDSGNLGLKSEGVAIYFPLNPNLCLVISDPILCSWMPNEFECRDIQNTLFLNSLQVFNSTRYIFSNTNNFQLAREIINRNPSYGDINRKRVTIA